MEERPIEEIAAVDQREMYHLDEVSHVAHNIHAERLRREVATGDSFVPHVVGRVHHHPRGCRVPAGSPHRQRACEWLPLGLREHDARGYRETTMGLVPGDVRRAAHTAGRRSVHRDVLMVKWPLASRWYRFLPISDEKDPRLQRLRRQLDLMPFSEFVCLPYRTLEVEAVLDRRILQEEHRALWCSIVPLIYFGTMEWHQVDRVIPQFGWVQNRPHLALIIDFLHAKDGRGSNQWFPQTFQRWHAFWQLFQVVQSADPGPTVDFIQWWILIGKRYLVLADRFHHLPPDEMPVEATQRQSGPHPPRPDVPVNRRSARRMMVGTRTTAWDWQWLDDMMAEDVPAAPPTQKNRCMPVSYACRRGAGRPRRGGIAGKGCGEGGDAAPTQQTQGGASTSQAVEEAGTSSHAYLSPTPQTQGTTIPSTMSSPSQQAFLDGLHSPRFEHLISDIMREGGSGYKPDT
ncbi:hypothetical protein PIB30_004097 [Stylosanthes scabra]|uniref:Aminotransferase-like plant mobile domain-containing protein n=1 Tax=Stylosanthes scabra TaxID=79078 RepID=A0ABU6Z2A5_9FABA|nr:hypothetical protein [Stylosanthes scabra]